ncbi:acetyl-CoA acetyltransferase [Actinophytocola sp.]|uniref:acetyl-CoA acetyltransferase n=1 Tax=Actinophytocola sp. TaxID=1872138 RepID=UPI003D6B1CDB
MANPVYVLGGAQTDFARNFGREGLELHQIVGETVDVVLASAEVEPAAIGSIHVGNAFGELFSAQSQLGAMPATGDDRFWGKPATRHEAACASGSVAVLSAMAEIEAGRHDCVLVLGVEQQRNVSGDVAGAHQATAAWVGHDAVGQRYVWAHEFNRLAEEYDRRFGLRYEHIARIAEVNLENARRNPNAQTRKWTFDERSFTEDDTANPVVHGRLRRQDCGQVTDGAAGFLLASAEFAAEHAARVGVPVTELPRIAGWGHRVASLSLEAKLARSADEPYILPHLRGAITDAYARAGISGPSDVDAIETHDCFSINEYMAIDHFGITEPGESWKAVEGGWIELGGRIPVNPSGGLIGSGHPVGATGIRMVVDAAKQVSGNAGDYQVAECRRAATLNVGGSATTVVSFVVEAG